MALCSGVTLISNVLLFQCSTFITLFVNHTFLTSPLYHYRFFHFIQQYIFLKGSEASWAFESLFTFSLSAFSASVILCLYSFLIPLSLNLMILSLQYFSKLPPVTRFSFHLYIIMVWSLEHTFHISHNFCIHHICLLSFVYSHTVNQSLLFIIYSSFPCTLMDHVVL